MVFGPAPLWLGAALRLRFGLGAYGSLPMWPAARARNHSVPTYVW